MAAESAEIPQAMVPAKSALELLTAHLEGLKGARRAEAKGAQVREAQLQKDYAHELQVWSQSAHADIRDQVAVPLQHASCAPSPSPLSCPTFTWQHPGAHMAEVLS